MTIDCPLQTIVHPNEARCITALILRPKELTTPYQKRDLTNSWFCQFFKREIHCPIVRKIQEWSKIKK